MLDRKAWLYAKTADTKCYILWLSYRRHCNDGTCTICCQLYTGSSLFWAWSRCLGNSSFVPHPIGCGLSTSNKVSAWQQCLHRWQRLKEVCMPRGTFTCRNASPVMGFCPHHPAHGRVSLSCVSIAHIWRHRTAILYMLNFEINFDSISTGSLCICLQTCDEGIIRPCRSVQPFGDLHLDPMIWDIFDEAASCKQCNAATILAVSNMTGRPFRAIPGGRCSLSRHNMYRSGQPYAWCRIAFSVRLGGDHCLLALLGT